MEHSLTYLLPDTINADWVLILILMEHSLTPVSLTYALSRQQCLNPYSNGTLSDRLQTAL